MGSNSRSLGNQTELLDVKTWQWETRAPYPYETRIYWARTLHYNREFYVFGGQPSLSRIASYSPATDIWTSRGNLLTPRYRAGVIWADGAFLVVGGYMSSSAKKSSEKCRFNGPEILCEYQNPVEPTGKFIYVFYS